MPTKCPRCTFASCPSTQEQKGVMHLFPHGRVHRGLLSGSEIKSIRAGKASITESYCRFEGGEARVLNKYVAENPNAGYEPQDPRRKRKLLLQRTEIKKLQKKVKDVGVTLVPTLLFVAPSGYAKLKFSVAKGKKLHDKRQSLKDKDITRDLARMDVS